MLSNADIADAANGTPIDEQDSDNHEDAVRVDNSALSTRCSWCFCHIHWCLRWKKRESLLSKLLHSQGIYYMGAASTYTTSEGEFSFNLVLCSVSVRPEKLSHLHLLNWNININWNFSTASSPISPFYGVTCKGLALLFDIIMLFVNPRYNLPQYNWLLKSWTKFTGIIVLLTYFLCLLQYIYKFCIKYYNKYTVEDFIAFYCYFLMLFWYNGHAC